MWVLGIAPRSRAENLKSWPRLKPKTSAPWKNLSTEQVEKPRLGKASAVDTVRQNTHRVLKTRSKQANSPLKEVKGQSSGQIPPQHTECMTPGWDPDNPKISTHCCGSSLEGSDGMGCYWGNVGHVQKWGAPGSPLFLVLNFGMSFLNAGENVENNSTVTPDECPHTWSAEPGKR